jgi:phenylpropionate dioxygenase-like ring-hydroxylating dioxygenase large terminal subunit
VATAESGVAANIERGRTIPNAWYTDPSHLARERDRVFGSSWQYIGDAGLVAEPGTYTTAVVGDVPVVITRDEAGTLHALANVCRHRHHLVASGSGRRKTLQCPYHAWTYRLDGRLHRAPGVDLAERPECAALRLAPLAAETWGPFLFASLDPTIAPLAEHLGTFPERTRDFCGVDVGDMVFRRREEYTADVNWKVVIENFMECYHCPTIHAKTLPGLTIDPYEVESFEHADVLLTRDVGGHAPAVTGDRFADSEGKRFAFLALHPSTQFSVFGDMQAIAPRCVLPEGARSTRVVFDFYFARSFPESESEEFADFVMSVLEEDFAAIRSVQAGLDTRLFEHGYLGGHAEQAPWNFHRRLARDLVGAV